MGNNVDVADFIENGRTVVCDTDPLPEPILSPDFLSAWSLPYTPPPIPASREEALFFLSPGGRYCLGEILDLLNNYQRALEEPDALAKGKIALVDSAQASGNDWGAPEMMDFTLPRYFSGFSHLGAWLSEVCSQIFISSTSATQQAERCTDILWMTNFANDAAAQRDINVIKPLHDSLWTITDRADRLWDIDIYWSMVLDRLRKAADLNDTTYVDNPVMKDRNNQVDRQELHDSLKNDGVFDVQFYYYSPEGDREPIDEKYYKREINGLQNYLCLSNSMTIRDVYEVVMSEPRLPWSMMGIRPRLRGRGAMPNPGKFWNGNERQINEHASHDAKSNADEPVVPASGLHQNLI